MLYGIIGIISVLVRQFVLPNPFEPLGEGLAIGQVLLSPILLNWIAEPILHIVTFAEVGVIYHKGEMPGLGSFLYLIFYAMNVGVLWFASWLGLRWYTNLIIVVLYVTGFIWLIRSNDV